MTERNGDRMTKYSKKDILNMLQEAKKNCITVHNFQSMRYEDLFLIPDLSTFVIFPGCPQTGKVIRFLGKVVEPEGSPFKGDSNYIWKKQLSRYRSCYLFLMFSLRRKLSCLLWGERRADRSY